MSEIPRQSIESAPLPEISPDVQTHPEATTEHITETSVENPAIESIRDTVDAQAIPAENISKTSETADDQPATIFGVQHELKAQAYRRTLRRTRTQLKPLERPFSTFIHTPFVERSSAILGASVGRPSGVVTGASVALIGSSAALYAAKHYGFSYNYTLLFVLFAGGFIIGVLLELVIRLIKHRSNA